MQRSWQCFRIAIGLALLASCAPQPPYRPPVSPSSGTAARGPAAGVPAPAPLPAPAPPVLPQDSKIREQDIRAKTPPVKETKEPTKQASVSEARPRPETAPATAPPLPDDSGLLAKITPGISPQRAASLRLTEEGRKLQDSGDPAKALTPLERAITIDSSNPYGYFYLARAQYRLGRYKESLNFLDVAESRFGGEPFWLSEVHALRGENYRGLGQPQRAEASYTQSLRINSGNRTAAEGLPRVQADAQPAAK